MPVEEKDNINYLHVESEKNFIPIVLSIFSYYACTDIKQQMLVAVGVEADPEHGLEKQVLVVPFVMITPYCYE